MFESISGLPAHPLFVHAPIVLIPLTAIFALAAAASSVIRQRASWALALSALVTLGFTQMAVTSGYEFDELVAGIVNTDEHERLALVTRNLVALSFVLSTALAAVSRWWTVDGGQRGRLLSIVVSLATAAIAVMATVFAIRTGEEGARLVWDGVLVVLAE